MAVFYTDYSLGANFMPKIPPGCVMWYSVPMNNPCFYRLSVKALIVDETGRFLLAREADGTWDMLGGGLDHGEDPIDALQREITEETGLITTHISSSPKYFITAPRPGMDVFIANVLYEVELKDLDFTPSDECQELRYFSCEEARTENILPNVAKVLELYDPALHSARQAV